MSTIAAHKETFEEPLFFLTEEDIYEGNQPYFYDPAKYEWAKTLEDNWHILRDEFAHYIEGEQELEQTSINPPHLSSADAWSNVYFWNFMWQKHKNCKRFPKTYELLKSIPNLTFAEFTMLKPGAKVLPHIGETNTTIRGHLGIKIPGKFPDLGIKVGDQKRGWEDGKVVLFSDAHLHTVWNDTEEKRFVLVFDILRDEYADKIYWMNALALGALTVKYIDEKINFFKRGPKFIMKSAHYFFSALWYMYLPLQRRFSFLK